MIFQMSVYYGAFYKGKLITTTSTQFYDCKYFASDEFSELIFKQPMVNQFKKHGINPDIFEFRYLTNDEYNQHKNGEEIETTIIEFDSTGKGAENWAE